MPTHRIFLVLPLGLVACLGACERAAQSTTNRPSVETPRATAATEIPAANPAAPDSSAPVVEAQFSDSLVLDDTTKTYFSGADVRQIRGVLEAQLAKDQFTSTDTDPLPYGTACNNSSYPMRGYANDEVRVAFVRPRVVGMRFQGGSAESRLVYVGVEITRIAVVRRDSAGAWKGSIDVRRDSLEWRVNTREVGGKWIICGSPAHNNGYNADTRTDNPPSPWLPIRFALAEHLPTQWETKTSWANVRRIADSVATLPSGTIVEGNPEPKLPIYYRNICPFEGCEFGTWLACDTVRTLTEAKTAAPTAFVLQRGDTITALTGDVHVLQAGKVVFSRNVKIDQEGTRMSLTPADTIYPLLESGEGYGSWYFRGKESGGFFFFGETDDPEWIHNRPEDGYSVVRPSKHEWWVKGRNKKGQEGWFIPKAQFRGMSPHYEDGPFACPSK